jgi:hypothetical protein
LYAYQQTRGSEHPRRFLNGFSGYLQSDGFAGYDALARAQPHITGVGCWAHARRKFVDVQKAQAGAEPEGEAAWFVERIGELYGLERALAEATPEERYRRRQAEAAPILETISARLEILAGRVPPKSLLGKAVTYTRKQWPQLTRYIEAGETAIDNNIAERAIKPFVIGRKNWLFANTPAGATASARLYGLIETAKANGVEPYRYLAHLFSELPQSSIEAGDAVEDLLPWNVELPDPARYRMSLPMDLFERLTNIQALVTGGGEVTIGQLGPVECAATACDEHHCLAMLVKRDDESLTQLLERLDAAIDHALEEGEITDEINEPM